MCTPWLRYLFTAQDWCQWSGTHGGGCQARPAVTSLSGYYFDASHLNIFYALSTHSCRSSSSPCTCHQATIKTHDGCLRAPPFLPGVLKRGFTKTHKLWARKATWFIAEQDISCHVSCFCTQSQTLFVTHRFRLSARGGWSQQRRTSRLGAGAGRKLSRMALWPVRVNRRGKTIAILNGVGMGDLNWKII